MIYTKTFLSSSGRFICEQYLIPLPIICSNLFKWCHASIICIVLIFLKSIPSLATTEPIIILIFSPFIFDIDFEANISFSLFFDISLFADNTIYLPCLNLLLLLLFNLSPVYDEDNTRKIYIDDGLDKKYSKICSYSENCDYNCTEIIKNDEKNYDTFDKILFKSVFYNICDYIKQLYENKLSYKLEELVELLYEKIDCDVQKCCVLNVYQDELKKNKNIKNNNISDYDIEIKYPIPVDTGPYGDRCPTTWDIVYEYNIDKYSDPHEIYIFWIFMIIIIFCLLFPKMLSGK